MTLTEIRKLSPVKIVYVSEYPVRVRYYNYGKFIEISKGFRPALHAVLLLHEIGHAIHHAKNCKCMQLYDHTLAEYHAERFVMKHIKGNGRLIKAFIETQRTSSNSSSDEHKDTAKRIMGLKSYAKLEIKK